VKAHGQAQEKESKGQEAPVAAPHELEEGDDGGREVEGDELFNHVATGWRQSP
jgi:hypothetical protein